MNNNKQYFTIKENIDKLIELRKIDEAKAILREYEQINKKDPDIYNLKASILLAEDNPNDAIKILTIGKDKYPNDFDLFYNLGYINEQIGKSKEALNWYLHSQNLLKTENKSLLKEAILRVGGKDVTFPTMQKKIVVFVKPGLDSFINDIINELSSEYKIKKILVTNTKQINEGMKWADLCWFEWCDELVIYGSKLEMATKKSLICRLHSYEAFTDYISYVNWTNINKIIFVAEHIRDYVLEQVKNIKPEKCVIIPNGINLDKYNFKRRKPGFNLAYLGYINYKKGPMLLLQAFKSICDKDNRYKLHIAGKFQDARYVLYFKQMIREMNLQNNVFYNGWQENIDEWLEDKNYIISTSVLEGNPMGVMEAMAKGIKPLIHNFFGGNKQFYGYTWNTIEECLNMILDSDYDSKEYRKFIKEKFSLDKQIKKCKELIDNLIMLNQKKMAHLELTETKKTGIDSDYKIQRYYDDFISYLKQDREKENPRHTYLKSRLRQVIKKGDSVLDLGCGIGITTEYINSLGVDKVVGVDLSPKLIEYAKETVSNIEFMVHDITTLDLNEKFEVISLCDVMEHVPREKYANLFAVVKKHLKENGTVYISIPDPEYINLIRKYAPEKLQIIDNNINYAEIDEYCKTNDLYINHFDVYSIFIEKEYNEYIIKTKSSYTKKWEKFIAVFLNK